MFELAILHTIFNMATSNLNKLSWMSPLRLKNVDETAQLNKLYIIWQAQK